MLYSLWRKVREVYPTYSTYVVPAFVEKKIFTFLRVGRFMDHCSQGRTEVAWRQEQGTSLAPPCLNPRSFESKCTVLKKVMATLLELFGTPNDSAPGALFLPFSPSLRRWLQWQHNVQQRFETSFTALRTIFIICILCLELWFHCEPKMS